MNPLVKMDAIATGVATFARLRRTPSRFNDRQSFLAWQNARLTRWLDHTPRRVEAFEGIPFGTPLENYPVMDKARLMARFDAYNQPGITAETAWAAFEGSRMAGPFHVGASTGTSGNRGLYVISERERFAWLGAILSKTLPDIWKPWAPRERVAVILPLHTRLYDAANDTGRISLRFFGLQDGPETWIAELLSFAPTTLIAPPKILAWLGRRWNAPPIRRAYSGAEVLDPLDRSSIETSFGVPLGQIYMATEGLLGVSCQYGRLHLAEDVLHFQFEPVGNDGLVSPIITDFSRRTQVMLKYRLNDLLRLSGETCTCGSPCRVVEEIAGRSDDCFTWRGQARHTMITPDVLRNTVLDADRGIDDFRLFQEPDGSVSLVLSPSSPPRAAAAARDALKNLFSRRGAGGVEVRARLQTLPLETSRKLRRVEVRRAGVSPAPVSANI